MTSSSLNALQKRTGTAIYRKQRKVFHVALFPRFQRVLPEEREVDSKCTRNANRVLASMIVRAKLPFLSQMLRKKNSKFLPDKISVWRGLFLLSKNTKGNDGKEGRKEFEELHVNKKPAGDVSKMKRFLLAEDDSSTSLFL